MKLESRIFEIHPMEKGIGLVFLPTYNERDNVSKIFWEIHAIAPDFDILFLDDHSPDGTGRIIDEIVAQNSYAHVIHRTDKLGIGSAHVEGINWAYQKGYKILVSMDCDFTHSPKHITELLPLLQEFDVVIGSRYLRNSSLPEWKFIRLFLTFVGHFLTKVVLRIPYDATGAYRAYRLDRIPQEIFQLVRSSGFSFFFESLFILMRNGISITEVPIQLPARTHGKSKMAFREVWRSAHKLLTMGGETFLHPERFQIRGNPILINPQIIDLKNWNNYWDKKNNSIHWVYDGIAKFYRKFIIRPLLNHFVRKHFQRGEKILHAGCGSGQVDVDVRKYISITAMDISHLALSLYQHFNGCHAQVLHGNIQAIPAVNESYNGIYNLGVMEHFSWSAIRDILREFHRVLKPKGKILLFWPPEFGSSVIFLKGVHFILNRILRQNIKLHPDEESRICSQSQVQDLLINSGFQLKEYYFGLRDYFTYVVVVATKV